MVDYAQYAGGSIKAMRTAFRIEQSQRMCPSTRYSVVSPSLCWLAQRWPRSAMASQRFQDVSHMRHLTVAFMDFAGYVKSGRFGQLPPVNRRLGCRIDAVIQIIVRAAQLVGTLALSAASRLGAPRGAS